MIECEIILDKFGEKHDKELLTKSMMAQNLTFTKL
jgi:hypothetical protein